MVSTEASLITKKEANSTILKLNIEATKLMEPEIVLYKSRSSSTLDSNSTHLSDDSHPNKDNMTINTGTFNGPANNSRAFLSKISKLFVLKLYTHINSRRIFSTEEYTNSFTGEEAINVLIDILGVEWPRADCKRVARSIMPSLFKPILYSSKSFKNNRFYDSSKEIYTLHDTIDFDSIQYTQGILTPLLDCYTPLCAKHYSNGCYAYGCPNRGSLLLSSRSIKELHRHISSSSGISSVVSSQDTLASRSWAKSVSHELFQATPPQEMKRQEAIYELIYTEEDYIRDLMLLKEVFAQPLSIAQCVEPERRESFCKEIFGNYAAILSVHQNMYRELRDYQITSQELGVGGKNIGYIDQIGNIMINYVDQFTEMYMEYGPHFIIAEYAVQKEMETNILFHNFIREREKQAETRKLPLRHYLIIPITRLQRYPLLLEAIMKRTKDEPEKRNLATCIAKIRKIAAGMDVLTSEKKEALHLRQIHDKIQFKPGAPKFKLDLLEPGRTLIYEGLLRRRSHLGDSVDLYVFLFDHLLIMTKQKKTASGRVEAYIVSRSPIPLPLLTIGDVVDGSLFTSLRSTHRLSTSSPYNLTINELSSTTTLGRPSLSTTINQTAFLIHHLGRNGSQDVLMTDSPSSCSIWRDTIVSAQTQLALKEMKQSVFRSVTVNDATFASHSVNGKVICATSFVGSSGETLLVVGTFHGIWIGPENKHSKLTKVLRVNEVTQIGVIQSHHILLVLADKVLTAYPITMLDPTSPTNIIHKLNRWTDTSALASRVLSSSVCYFNIGTCYGRTLIVSMKRKGHDSHFKAFEIVCGDLSNPKNSKYVSTKTSFMNKHHAWFKLYQSFYVGSDSTAVHFLKSRLLIQCNYGYEVLDPENLSDCQNLPNLRDTDFSFIKYAEAVPLNIFRYKENFLVCYNQFAFMITSHGKLIKKNYKRIEWEGNPQSVAFCSPYLFAFDPHFIEIRHADTGDLVQIVVNGNLCHLSSTYTNTNDNISIIYATTVQQHSTEYQDIIKFEPLI